MAAKIYSCLVTGACGPVGSQLVKHLTAAGHKVVAIDTPMALDSTSPTITSRVSMLKSKAFAVRKVDLSIPGSIDPDMQNLDFVFAAPWVEGPKTAWKEQYASHVQGTANLIDSISRLNKGLRRLVLMSSAGIYSPSDLMASPLTEESAIAPPTNPLRAIWFAEHQILTKCPTAEIPYTIVRTGTIADFEATPGLKAIGTLVKSPVVPLPDNLTGRVHLANWEDVCGAAVHLAKYASGENGIFNVADGKPIAAIDLVRAAADSVGHRVVDLPSIPLPLMRQAMKMGVGLGSLASSYLPIKNIGLDEDAMGLLGTDQFLSVQRLDDAGYTVQVTDPRNKIFELFRKL